MLSGGTITAGDPVSLERTDDRSVPLLELVRLFYDRSAPAADPNAPCALRWPRARADLKERLARATA